MTSMVFNNSILTIAEMRKADALTIAKGTSSQSLMERAGKAIALAIEASTGPAKTLILCGPGNNGGDGYVVAEILRQKGWPVSVARSGPPTTDDAQYFADRYKGPITDLREAKPAPILIDALFGTGSGRPLLDEVAEELERLMKAAVSKIAVDLPSGIDGDSGALLGARIAFDLTIAIGALKPAHLLVPAATLCGRVVIADIGIATASDTNKITRPVLSQPTFKDYKFSRGFVFVVGGDMAGAARLTARAAQRTGAGYVLLGRTSDPEFSDPQSIIERYVPTNLLNDQLADNRIDVTVVGPGLGRHRDALKRLNASLNGSSKLIIDADALTLLAQSAVPIARRFKDKSVILTPHEGEFQRLFGQFSGTRIERARQAAKLANAVVVLKGASTIAASPDGKVALSPPQSAWLSTAGTGDVLAGCIATHFSQGMSAFDAACAGIWFHGKAAVIAGPGLNADDLVLALQKVQANYHG